MFDDATLKSGGAELLLLRGQDADTLFIKITKFRGIHRDADTGRPVPQITDLTVNHAAEFRMSLREGLHSSFRVVGIYDTFQQKSIVIILVK
jgi:hypothetical protein